MREDIGFPIEEVYDLYFPKDAEALGHLAMIYYSYLDDSSDKTRSEVVVSASFIGDKDQWSRLRNLWNKRLKQEGLKYFKSSEYHRLRGQFERFRSPDQYPAPTGRKAAGKIVSDLEDIIHSVGIAGMGIVIPMNVFNEVVVLPEAQGKLGRDPYHLALQSLFFETVKAVRDLPGHHRVAFVHDDGPSSPKLFELYGDFKKKNRRTAESMVGFSVLDDKSHPPLQAADLIANLTTQLALAWLKNPSQANLRRLRASILRIAVWNKTYMLDVLGAQRNRRSH